MRLVEEFVTDIFRTGLGGISFRPHTHLSGFREICDGRVRRL